MPKHVDLRLELDLDDWRHGDIWCRDGVLSAFVTLKLRGKAVVDYRVVGINNSAVSLLRSVLRPHTAAADARQALTAKWPMFFCAGDLPNKCGVIADFSVDHDPDRLVMHSFYGCEVDASTRIDVPHSAWASAVIGLGSAVLRQLPTMKRNIKVRRQATYRRYRAMLVKELASARSGRGV